MKLTKKLRGRLLSDIMADLPRVDYEEELRVFLQKDALDKLPVELRNAIALNPEVVDYLYDGYVYPFRCVGLGGVRVANAKYKPDVSEGSGAKRIHDLHEKQRDQRHKLQTQIEGVLEQCKTTQEFVKVFPQFEGYIPKTEVAVITNLPATQVVEEMIAAGWKQKEVA